MHLSNLGSLNSMTSALASGRYPSVSTIARVADSMNLVEIRNVAAGIYKRARKQKMLSAYCGTWIGIIDGHEVNVSEFCKCGHCRKRKLKDKDGTIKYQYYHSFTAFILAGPKFSFILDAEPIVPGEGEITSAYRLLERVCKTYPKAFEVVIGDGLYLKGTIFKLLEGHHKYAIAVLKEERRQLFEEANRLSLMAEPKIYKQGKTTYKVWDHTIEGAWDSYKKPVRVIRSEEIKTVRQHSKELGRWQTQEEKADWYWATNLPKVVGPKNAVSIFHSRWQIENCCFGEIASTWNADHVYRHSVNAIVAFILFLFIVLNIFNIFFARNIKDKRIKSKTFVIDLIKAEFLIAKWTHPIPL